MRSRMIALVLVVVAFAGLSGAFLVEREKAAAALAAAADAQAALAAQTIAQETRFAELERELAETEAVAETVRKALETEIYFLERRVGELTRETAEKMTQRTALLGLALGEVAEAQEIRLESLRLETSRFGYDYYYDGANLCYYLLSGGEEPSGDAVVLGYMSAFQSFFEKDDYGNIISELFSVTGHIYSYYWKHDAENGLYYYYMDFSHNETDYYLRLYTDESDHAEGTSFFEVTLGNSPTVKGAADTISIIMEKAGLLGLTMGEVAERQGVGLNNLQKLAEGAYYDPTNQCLYTPLLTEGDLKERLCTGYATNLADMFDDTEETLLIELEVLFGPPQVDYPGEGVTIYRFLPIPTELPEVVMLWVMLYDSATNNENRFFIFINPSNLF